MGWTTRQRPSWVANDVAMLVLVGKLKRREALSARLGDVLSYLYHGSAVVKQHSDDGARAGDQAVVEWPLEDSLAGAEEAFAAFIDNFPRKVASWLMKRLLMPFGSVHSRLSDAQARQVAGFLLEPSDARDRLIEGTYAARYESDPVGRLDLALEAAVAAEPAEQRMRAAYCSIVSVANLDQWLTLGVGSGVIGDFDAGGLRRAMALTACVVAADERHRDERARLAIVRDPPDDRAGVRADSR